MEVEEICCEFLQLLRKQRETLDSATFLGMTEADWREYEGRQARIRELSDQISRFPASSNSCYPQKTWQQTSGLANLLLTKVIHDALYCVQFYCWCEMRKLIKFRW